MSYDEQNKPGKEDQSFHRTVYKINGKLLNYVIKTWVGLMIGITLMETFAPAGDLDALDMLKVKFIVISMFGVIVFGTFPWLVNPKDTWRLAKSEPGNVQGICNRCAAFLPFVGLIVLVFAMIFWKLNF
jgi:hypothetical protein